MLEGIEMIEDLQKALDKFPDMIEKFPTLEGALIYGKAVKQWRMNFEKLFSGFKVDYDKQMVRLRCAEEKNVEYAKLVAAQAEEYAEKNASLQQKNVIVSRKQLSDKLKEYKKIEKTTSSEFWREGARWVIEFIEKELLDEGKTGEGK